MMALASLSMFLALALAVSPWPRGSCPRIISRTSNNKLDRILYENSYVIFEINSATFVLLLTYYFNISCELINKEFYATNCVNILDPGSSGLDLDGSGLGLEGSGLDLDLDGCGLDYKTAINQYIIISNRTTNVV
jgi:hypothetical protein